MPVGLSGRAMVPPACSVVGLMAVRVRFPKLPTSTSPGAAATGWGAGPTGMAGPACRVATSIGVTALLPESATNAVAAPEAATDTAMATGADPTTMGVPARQVPRSTGVTLLESRLATSATPLPSLPPGATATASGSTPTPTTCSTCSVAVSISCNRSSPCVTTRSARPPGA